MTRSHRTGSETPAGLQFPNNKRGAGAFAFMLFALAATDLALFPLGPFPLTLFLPAWAFSLVATSSPRLKPEDERPAKWLKLSASAICVAALFSLDSSKLSSLAYSAVWLVFAAWLLGQRETLQPGRLRQAMGWVLIAYAASAALGTVLVLTGTTESLWGEIAKVYYDNNTDSYRLQGLASEPSYAAIVVASAWLCRQRLSSMIGASKHSHWPMTLLLLLMMTAFRSVYGTLLSLVLASTLITAKRRVTLRQLLMLATVAIVSLYLFVHFFPDSRVQQIVTGVLAFDIEQWIATDNSSYMRFGPLYYYFMTEQVSSLGFWLGHGAASSTSYFGDAFGALAGPDVDALQVGFVPAFLYDYGMLAFLSVIGLGCSVCRGPFHVQATITFILMLFNANFNTQLFWWVVAALFLSSAPNGEHLNRDKKAASIHHE